MKFFAVFAAIVAVACANNTWTVNQLSDAIQSPHTDAALKPYLEAALNQMMSSLWAGQEIEAVTVAIPAVDSTSLTLNQLSEAIQNPATDPALLPYLEAALNQIMDALMAGMPVESATVGAPAMEIHHYTLHELSVAIQDPNTNHALLPYLEHALNEMMEASFGGQQMSAIVIAVPAGLIPVIPEVIPSPVEVEAPESPAPVVPETPAAPSSPLVQIIININQEAATPVVRPEPVQIIDATPVDVIDVMPVVEAPINIIDVMPVVETPANIIDVMPVVETPANIIDVMPVVVPNPVVILPAPVVVTPVQVVDSAPVAAEPVLIGTPAIGA